MTEWLRFMHGPLLNGVGGLIVLVIIWWLIRRFAGLSKEEQHAVNIAVLVVTLLIVAGTTWFTLTAGVMNQPHQNIDQGTVIERSDYVRDQAEKHQQDPASNQTQGERGPK